MDSIIPSTFHKVLLVVDDGAVRDMMTGTLERKGFKVSMDSYMSAMRTSAA